MGKRVGNQLDGLSQAHLVGENAAQSHGRNGVEPGQALDLVGTQLTVETAGHLRPDLARSFDGLHVFVERVIATRALDEPVELEGAIQGQASAVQQQ